MNKVLAILLFTLFNLSGAFGHGTEEHETLIPTDEVKLIKINENYLSNVKKIFSKKCLSCHGINKNLPWYYSIPGPKQLIDHDIKEAKKHMDMSNDFPFGGHGTPLGDLKALKKTIKNDDMPPLRYEIMHWESGLTKDEVRVINNWIIESESILSE